MSDADNYTITDMEGDPIGFCSDCEAWHEGLGEKAPCDKCQKVQS